MLRDGKPVVLRPLRPTDREIFLAAFRSLSDRSRWLRFHKLDPRLRESDIAYLTQVDQVDHVALAVLTPAGGIALGRFVRLTGEHDCADMALTVLDAWQRRGVATLLLAALMRRARELGIATFTASVLDRNIAAMTLLDGLMAQRRREGSAWVFRLPTAPERLARSPLAEILVARDSEMARRNVVLGPARPAT